MPKSAMQSYFDTSFNPSITGTKSLYDQLRNFGNYNPAPVQNISHVTPRDQWSTGFSDFYKGMQANNAIPVNNQNNQGMFSAFQSWMNRPQNMTQEQFGSLDNDQLIKAGGLKTNLQGTLDTIGAGTNILGAGFGLYNQLQNQKYNKEMINMNKRAIASDNANKSAFARAAGGTYVPA